MTGRCERGSSGSRKRRGAKIGRVAVMRRLTTILWHMLKKNQKYRYDSPIKKHKEFEAFEGSTSEAWAKGSVFRGASPEPPKDLTHKAQRGMASKRKEQGRTLAAHPHSSPSPDCGARVGSHRSPILRLSPSSIPYHHPRRRKQSTFVTVLIRRLAACESLRLHADSICPVDLAPYSQACKRLWSGLEFRRTIEQILSVSGELAERGRNLRSAGVHEGTG